MNDTYPNFIQKLIEVVDKEAPVKNKRIIRILKNGLIVRFQKN